MDTDKGIVMAWELLKRYIANINIIEDDVAFCTLCRDGIPSLELKVPRFDLEVQGVPFEKGTCFSFVIEKDEKSNERFLFEYLRIVVPDKKTIDEEDKKNRGLV